MSARAFDVTPGVISVNGVEIARDDIAREAQHHPGATPLDTWREAARALVIRELLLQESYRQGLTPEPQNDGEGCRESDEEALIRQLIEARVETLEPDAEACQRYYAQNRGRFRSADLFEAAHILIAAEPGNAAARSAAHTKASALIAELRAAPRRFGEAAALHSACTSAAQGGNLGQIGPGQTVPQFEKALKTMEEGAISLEPVETRYGFHVIRLDRRIPGRELPFESVAGMISDYLSVRARHDALYSYVRWLAVNSRITGIDLETGRIDPAAVSGGERGAKQAAMRRFANGASAEDWTSLVGTVQRAEDPAHALEKTMADWRPPARPEGPSPRPRTLFTYGGSG
ncbi:peptidylprolyl isomerase [Aestuariivirga sp.]|uniref:peptidylprolyl isomerase n=1 Tax=Aestuariivirga sp. TaxID=2650926 RepID=UPI00391C556E